MVLDEKSSLYKPHRNSMLEFMRVVPPHRVVLPLRDQVHCLSYKFCNLQYRDLLINYRMSIFTEPSELKNFFFVCLKSKFILARTSSRILKNTHTHFFDWAVFVLELSVTRSRFYEAKLFATLNLRVSRKF